MEELLLMTWVVEQPTFVIVADPAMLDPAASLAIVDADRLATLPPVPVIAIGTTPTLPGVSVLSPKLTSRELKQAIRHAMPRGPRTSESALG